ncbi:nucleoside phosphorylase [Oscillospiraceae bacterium HV4-5-C5C]|nr:nucleoside phosphorylase [Oscillospiraceae bacterium HV4-5-C5C]
MILRADLPLLEFDDAQTAQLNPEHLVDRPFSTDKLIITFFPEVMEQLRGHKAIELEREIPGENPLLVYRFTDHPEILITLGFVGCPACGSNLDLLNAMGINKVMFCGGGGVLDPDFEPGQLLLVDGAIRDEGFSHHYLAPSRYVHSETAVTDRIAAYLDAQQIACRRGLTWTTDAIFRETPDKVAQRRQEGAQIVEMEQAGCIAVAQFRHFSYGAIIYGGDDVSQTEWADRGWRSLAGIRYDLVMLCQQLVQLI